MVAVEAVVAVGVGDVVEEVGTGGGDDDGGGARGGGEEGRTLTSSQRKCIMFSTCSQPYHRIESKY